MPRVSQIRVLVAVVDPVAAVGLRTILSEAADMACLPPLEDLDEVRAAVAADPPDVLVLDVALRRADARLLPDLITGHPEMKILVYVDHSPLDCALRHLLERGGRTQLSSDALRRLDDCCLTSLRQHAHGCLGTGVDVDGVVASVRAVQAGEVAAAPWAASLAGMLQSHGKRSHAGAPISVRELEIMTFLAEGLTNRQIAERLGVREQTVKNHVTRTMEKLGVQNRLEVGLLAARHNLRLASEEGPSEN